MIVHNELNSFIVRQFNFSKLDLGKKQTGLHHEADGVQNVSLTSQVQL